MQGKWIQSCNALKADNKAHSSTAAAPLILSTAYSCTPFAGPWEKQNISGLQMKTSTSEEAWARRSPSESRKPGLSSRCRIIPLTTPQQWHWLTAYCRVLLRCFFFEHTHNMHLNLKSLKYKLIQSSVERNLSFPIFFQPSAQQLTGYSLADAATRWLLGCQQLKGEKKRKQNRKKKQEKKNNNKVDTQQRGTSSASAVGTESAWVGHFH